MSEPTKVYVLTHESGDYGETYHVIRAVYLSETSANAAITAKAGCALSHDHFGWHGDRQVPKTATTCCCRDQAHNEHCCSVEDWETAP